MTEKPRRLEAGLLHYLREAFFFRWNLLLFVGAAGAALIGPAPEVVLPLVGAVELAYLAGLTAIPRFRAAIDAKVHARGRGGPVVQSASPSRGLNEMLGGLDTDGRVRFERLRNRCLTMRGIARGVRGSQGEEGQSEEIRTPGLDRLLWVFLRLLSSEQALERFVTTTQVTEIDRQLSELRKKAEGAASRQDERIQRSLTDSIATAELRLENHRKAQGNLEFVQVELDRIEGKIQALAEMSVSHQDPDYISSQVDSVAESMAHTERAILELNHITGLTDEMQGPPSILDADLASSQVAG